MNHNTLTQNFHLIVIYFCMYICHKCYICLTVVKRQEKAQTVTSHQVILGLWDHMTRVSNIDFKEE